MSSQARRLRISKIQIEVHWWGSYCAFRKPRNDSADGNYCASRKPRNDSADGNYTSFLIPSSDAHFFHDTSLHPDLDLPLASRTEAGEHGSAPPNRRASAVCWKTPKTDPSGSLVV